MNNNKINEYYKRLEQNGSIDSTLKEKIQRIKNENDLRKIIENEIIPLGRKIGVNFTTEELIRYEKKIDKKLNDIESENSSQGIIDKNIFLDELTSLMVLGLGHTLTESKAHAINASQAIQLTKQQLASIEYSLETSPTKTPITHDITDAAQTTPDTTLTPSDGTISENSQSLINSELTNQFSNYKKLYYLEALNLCDPYIYIETKLVENMRLFNGYIDSITMYQNNQGSYYRNYLYDEGKGSPNLIKILFPSPAGKLNTNINQNNKTLNKLAPSHKDIANIISCLFKYRNNDPETIARFTLLNNWSDFGKDFVVYICPMEKDSDPPTYDYNSFFQETETNNYISTKKYGNTLKEIKKKLSKIPDPFGKQKQLYCDLLNYESDTISTNKEINKIHTLFSILQNAIHMIDFQEKNSHSKKDGNIRIFSKYTTEKLLLSYLIEKFDKDEQITEFYSKIAEQLNILNISNEHAVNEKKLNNVKARLKQTAQLLTKYKENEYSPYKDSTKENGTCYSIQLRENEKIYFSKTFAICSDTAVLHVINLLIYSQGVHKQLDDPWENVLPPKNSIEGKELNKKLKKVLAAIKGKRRQIPLYSLKDRLQMFFLHQKNVGVDDCSECISYTLWEYAICNLTEPNGEFDPINYRGNKIYELNTGYKNMLTLMCRCAKVLFPEKDIKTAYEKVKECPEYTHNQKLTIAIKAVFKLFNEGNCITKVRENDIKVIYPDLGNLSFSISQTNCNAKTEHNPSIMKILTLRKIAEIEKSKNDFTIMIANHLSGKEIALQEDFHKLFFRKGLYYDRYKKTNSLTLSSDKVINSDFLHKYQVLKFLKYAQEEEHNYYRIGELLNEHRISYSNISSCLNAQTYKGKIDITDFIFNNYINSTDTFKLFSDGKKTYELITGNHEITIIPFDDHAKFAESNTNTKFRYTLDKNQNAVLYPVQDKENLYIPNKITIDRNTIKVVGIGKFACHNFKKLNKVLIEKSESAIETDFTIGKFAFCKCSNLNLITPSIQNIKNLIIQKYAFYSCKSFKSFDLSSNDNLETLDIDEYAFSNSSIASITTPKNVMNLTIGEHAFYSCQSFKSFDLSSSEKLKTVFINSNAFSNSSITSIAIPKNATNLTIKTGAFFNCTQLTSLNISSNDNLETLDIDSNAFSNSSITSITTPKNVTNLTIGNSAFSNCNQLTCCNLSSCDKLENLHINEYAFYKSVITSIFIPKNVTNLTIGNSAFANCSHLTSFDLSPYDKLENLCIDEYAFSNSTIASITIPKSVKNLTIGCSAFKNCTQLTNFDLSSCDELETLCIYNISFYKSGITSFTIPKSTQELHMEPYCFPPECKVQIPKKLKKQSKYFSLIRKKRTAEKNNLLAE